MVGGSFFANHEDGFSRTNEAQFLPRDPLDRRRIASKGSDVAGETGVVGLQLLDLLGERIRPLALADELEQAPIPEERAHQQANEDDDRGEDRGLLPEAYFRAPALVSQPNLNLYLMNCA